MAIIMCSYCGYIGNGGNYEERIADVLKHEESYHKEERE